MQIYVKDIPNLGSINVGRISGLNQVADLHEMKIGDTVAVEFDCPINTTFYLGRPGDDAHGYLKFIKTYPAAKWFEWKPRNLNAYYADDTEYLHFTFTVNRANDYWYNIDIGNYATIPPDGEVIIRDMNEVEKIYTSDNATVYVTLRFTPHDRVANAGDFHAYAYDTGATIPILSCTGSGMDYILVIPRQTRSFGINYIDPEAVWV